MMGMLSIICNPRRTHTYDEKRNQVRSATFRGAKIIGTVLGAVVATVLTLGGCGSANDTADTDATQPITVNNVEPAAGLVPSDTNDLAGWKVVTQLFEGLVTFDENGELIYADATSITPNSDASVYTIVLKDGLKFSDGEAITAATYAKSWSFAANAANGQLGAAILSNIKGYDNLQDENGDKNAQLSGLEAVNNTTLKVTLSAPDSSFDYKVGDVAFLPLPSTAYADIDAFGESPVGNGPYVLSSWTHDAEIVLKPNNNYDGPRTVQNGGLTFKLYDTLEAAYADLQGGNLDVIDSIPNSSLSTYASDDSLQPFSKPGPGFKAFTIPQNLPHFQGEEGALRRKAISLAVDRDNIIEKILQGTATAATDFTAPPIAGYSKNLSGSDVLQFDKDQAKKLWSQADGIDMWDGTFRIAYSTDSGNKEIIEAITNSIKNTLGIQAEPFVYSSSKELSSAIHDRKVGAAFLQGLQSDYPHPEGYLVQAYDSAYAHGKGLNNGDYISSEFDSLIDKAAQETQLKNAIEYYQQSEVVLFKDLPVIPLWYTNVTAAANKSLKQVSFNYMGLPEYYNLQWS